ncbi:MAG: hypothetical protein PHI64_12835 [Zoogloea sp.]|uniref:hypothetical protein n=1 Tax=Zoogloea sp. TaxID=49181 RepID=UPI00263934F5|nr:hypothetical protein [Zoogloea sp.]MDD2989834.1 hypothetical protein [Zoogloea sp.]
MNPEDLIRWRIQMDLSPAAAALALKITERTVYNYEHSITKIPYSVDLACAALVAKLAPFSASSGHTPH